MSDPTHGTQFTLEREGNRIDRRSGKMKHYLAHRDQS